MYGGSAITKESIRKVWPYFADKKMRKKKIADETNKWGDKEKHWIFNKEYNSLHIRYSLTYWNVCVYVSKR